MSGIYGEEYGQDIIPGEIGSNAITQAADNSGNTVANVGGLTESVFDPTYGGTLSAVNQPLDWSKALGQAKNFINENKGLITAAGALFAANSSPTIDKKTGYQGGIPLLQASRSMYTRPPTKEQGYRPGAGGIDYGGDVTYTRMAPGSDPWAALSGTSGSAAGANLSGLGGVAGANVPEKTVGVPVKPTPLPPPTKVIETGGVPVKPTPPTPSNLGSAGYQAAIKAGLTPMQYLNNINQWILDNPRASKDQIAAAMKEFGVSDVDLQTALGQSNFSDATKYALTHGGSLQQQNQIIEQWLRDHPYATKDEIQKAMDAVRLNDEDIARAMYGLNSSAAKEYAVVHDMGLDQLYKNILDYQAAGHTPEEIAAAMAATGVEQRDINAANKFATAQGYTANPTSAAAVQNFLPVVDSVVKDNLITKDEEVATPKGLDTTNDIYKYFANPATQAALASGNTRSIAETMQALGWSPEEVAAATGTNAADVKSQYEAALADMNDRFAAGGMAKGRYLQGDTDGMADELPAQIGADEPAALSHGEFVIPADVVSHLGNGNSDAGAKKLYQMMDKIRMARTGNKKQGKRINPDKFMPGGLAQAYAKGGKVKKYAGETSSMVTANNQYNQGIQGIESNLSNWAGPYVTNMLGQGQALANMPYAAYMGPLTAGESPLQTGAFKTAAGLTTPTSIGTAASTAGGIATAAQGLTYDPTKFGSQYTAPAAYKPVTTDFTSDIAKSYMNPYIQQALDPQIAEARRQSQITQQQNAAKMTQAGAFGGGRQAILDAETQRALGANLANITGQGYSTAYDKAMAQFNADQARKAQEAQFGAQQNMTSAQMAAQYGLAGQQAAEQSKQFGANYGLQGLQAALQAAQTQGALGTQENQAAINNLNAQLAAGAQQRGIESEGIAADKAQFEEARANPYKMVQFQQSLLQGLPLAAQSYQGIEPNALLKAAQGATTVNQLLKNLNLI